MYLKSAWKRNTRRGVRDARDYLDLLHPLSGQKPLSRVKYVRDGTATRDNSELCLSSSLSRCGASTSSRAFVLLSTSRGISNLSLAILLRSPDSFPPRPSLALNALYIASSIHDPLRLDSSLETVLNNRGKFGIETMINTNIFDAPFRCDACIIFYICVIKCALSSKIEPVILLFIKNAIKITENPI